MAAGSHSSPRSPASRRSTCAPSPAPEGSGRSRRPVAAPAMAARREGALLPQRQTTRSWPFPCAWSRRSRRARRGALFLAARLPLRRLRRRPAVPRQQPLGREGLAASDPAHRLDAAPQEIDDAPDRSARRSAPNRRLANLERDPHAHAEGAVGKPLGDGVEVAHCGSNGSSALLSQFPTRRSRPSTVWTLTALKQSSEGVTVTRDPIRGASRCAGRAGRRRAAGRSPPGRSGRPAWTRSRRACRRVTK